MIPLVRGQGWRVEWSEVAWMCAAYLVSGCGLSCCNGQRIAAQHGHLHRTRTAVDTALTSSSAPTVAEAPPAHGFDEVDVRGQFRRSLGHRLRQ